MTALSTFWEYLVVAKLFFLSLRVVLRYWYYVCSYVEVIIRLDIGERQEVGVLYLDKHCIL